MPKKSKQGRSSSPRRTKGKSSYPNKKAIRNKKIKRVRVIISLILALTFAMAISLQLAGAPSKTINTKVKATPTPSSLSTTEKLGNPNGSTKNSKIVTATSIDPYTLVDSMAIFGAFALARQTPSVSSKDYAGFLGKLQLTKNNPLNLKLDLAIKGNVLVDYVISKNGFQDRVCYAVKAPNVANNIPKQSVWVIDFEPASKDAGTLILVSLGVTNCNQAFLATSRLISRSQRTKISNASHKIIELSINKIPSQFLTPVGLALLDENRGFTPPIPNTPKKH